MTQFACGGISKFVFNYLESIGNLQGWTVLDIPAGEGHTSVCLKRLGANVQAFDLFPSFMKADGIESTFADLTEVIPVDDSSADMVLCQEGIEHISDHMKLFGEFNRVLKLGGSLLFTVPNKSNLIGRFTSLVHQGELLRNMPPSEVDSIWHTEDGNRVYYGHLFTPSAQKLRNMAAINGFELAEEISCQKSRSSLFLMPLLGPILFVLSTYAFIRSSLALKDNRAALKVLWQQYRINISFRVLVGKHIFWSLKKKENAPVARKRVSEMFKRTI